MAPCLLQVLRAADYRLTVARRRHDRLDQAGEAHLPGSCRQLLRTGGEGVGAGRQAQPLGRQTADPLPIHRQLRRPGRGHHPHLTGLLQGHEGVGGQRLDLGDDDRGAAGADRGCERRGVAHVHRQGVVGDLLGRSPVVAVNGRDLHPQAAERDRHLLADLAGAQQRHLRRTAGPGRTQDRGVEPGRGHLLGRQGGGSHGASWHLGAENRRRVRATVERYRIVLPRRRAGAPGRAMLGACMTSAAPSPPSASASGSRTPFPLRSPLSMRPLLRSHPLNGPR